MANQLTHQQVKNFVENESGSGCELLSREYVNTKTKMMFKCRCSRIFETNLDSFKHSGKQHCDKCGNHKGIQKTNEQFIKEVYGLVGDEYVFLEEYKNSATKIKCRHSICGHEWDVSPNSFLRGSRCPKRVGGNCFTYKNIRDFIEVKSGSGCKLLSTEYVSYNHKMSLQCKCGNEFTTDFDSFKNKNKRQCNKCGKRKTIEKLRKTNESFIEQVYEIVGNEYVFLEEYKNARTNIKCKHNVEYCGYEWDISPSNFLSNGNRCPQCTRPNYHRDTDKFKQEVYDLTKGEYLVLGEYIGSETKIKIKHNICNNEYYVQPNNFLSGGRCPQCNESKGEQRVRSYLEEEQIVFKQEYSFNGLLGVGGLPLRFDFAVFDGDNRFKLLIEYDGEFHYHKIHEDRSLGVQQVHDERKNKYCKDNNIPLLRIPYWEFDNIEKILEDNLNVKLNKKEGDIDDY